MPKIYPSPESLAAECGTTIGTSDWFTISQSDIDRFAEVTHDHQWIHVDPERASATEFGGTIAHGYLVLSSLPRIVADVYEIQHMSMGINYGADRIRFLTPVKAGGRIRGTVTLNQVVPIALGTQFHFGMVVELEGSSRPALIADVIYVYASAT